MEFILTLLDGLSIGSTYAMIALGYTMVYGIAKMLNFAHGDIIMAGGYAMFVTFNLFENPFLALGASVIFCIILGITIEKIAYKPLRGASPLAVLITAIAISMLLQSLAQIIFTSKPWQEQLVEWSNVIIGGVQLYTFVTLGCSIIIMVGLTLFVKYTRTGRAMVAVSEDRDAAQLMGINVNKIITITFAIGSALAAFAAFFMLIKTNSLQFTMGALPGIKAFAAAVIGGIGSIPGAMLGGLLMGVVESITLKIPAIANYTDAIEFLILIIILLVRPTGLIGKKRREKV